MKEENPIVKFLWFCSGANVKILKECQVEQGKYAAIGFTILMTSILASFSGGYALWTVFNSTKMAMAFGTFWGLLIGSLDRFLVATTKKEDSQSVQQLLVLSIRASVAIAIAFVIAKPLELKIYEKPIRAELTEQNSKAAEENQARLNQKYSEIGQLDQKNQALKGELERWESEKENAYHAVIGEAEGTDGTRKIGKGPVYDKKWQKYQESLRDYKIHEQDLGKQINNNQQRITELTKKRDQELEKIVVDKEKADDIMTHLEVLYELGQKKPIYHWSSLSIELLFILIDVAPILAKLLTERGLYDIILKKEEETQKQIVLTFLKQKEEVYLEAIRQIQQHEDYVKFHNRLVLFYVSKLRKEISQLAKQRTKVKANAMFNDSLATKNGQVKKTKN